MAEWALTTYRRDIAKAAGPWGLMNTSQAAAGADPARFLILAATIGSATVRSAGTPPERWVGAWASVADGTQALQCRRVAWATPEQGLLHMDAPFSGTVDGGIGVE